MIGIIISITILLMVTCLIFIIRNELVLKFRLSIIDNIYINGKKDIENGNDYRWRYEEFNKVSYEKMVFTFWKPLKVKSYYNNDNFVK